MKSSTPITRNQGLRSQCAFRSKKNYATRNRFDVCTQFLFEFAYVDLSLHVLRLRARPRCSKRLDLPATVTHQMATNQEEPQIVVQRVATFQNGELEFAVLGHQGLNPKELTRPHHQHNMQHGIRDVRQWQRVSMPTAVAPVSVTASATSRCSCR